MARDDFDDAVDAVTAAAGAFRGGLTSADATAGPHAAGINAWTPIYSHLLAEREAAQLVAGHRYDRLAEARLIARADRFDWRSYLTRPDATPSESA